MLNVTSNDNSNATRNNAMMQPHLVIKSEAMDLQYMPAKQQLQKSGKSTAKQQQAKSKQQQAKPKASATAAKNVGVKKRQKKKQELFDDDDDDDEDDNDYDMSDTDFSDDENAESSDDDSDDAATAHSQQRAIKYEPCDMDSDSGMPRTKSKQNLANSLGSNLSHSSYMNESLFDLMMSSKNRDAFFWQYNTQSKGPKTKKVLTLRNKDPHLHRDFYDPVFQLQSLNAKSGSGLNKLRKGDGNDVTPNPEKLYNLGNQIRDFIHKSYAINNACFGQQQQSTGATGVFSGAGTPINGSVLSTSLDNQLSNSYPTERVNLKREKNKIASRACRLKKKAQHEANKIKLFGLNAEHSKLEINKNGGENF